MEGAERLLKGLAKPTIYEKLFRKVFGRWMEPVEEPKTKAYLDDDDTGYSFVAKKGV
jgi:hypothetical protein